jgi:hypothetical protein
MLVLCVEILSNEGVLLAGHDWETKKRSKNNQSVFGLMAGGLTGLGLRLCSAQHKTKKKKNN